MSGHALVVHASRHGHSAEIAGRVAATLGEHVADVRVHDLAEEARTATAGVIAELVEKTGWRPDRTEAVAGAIQWQAYDPLTRLLMRFRLRRRSDVPRDRSRDVEYTDWVALDGVVRELGHVVADDPPIDAARPGSYARTP